MKPPDPVRSPAVEGYIFLLLLAAITLAFGWILLPFFSAVFWGVVLGILFRPLYRKLVVSLRQHRTSAALVTVLAIVVIVVIPLVLISASLVQEGAAVYQKIESGDLNFGRYFEQIVQSLPAWLVGLLDRFGIGDLASLQSRLAAGIAQGSQAAAKFVASQAVGIGQNTLDFVIGLGIALYLAFFMLRDGPALARRIDRALPMDPGYKRALFGKFTTVVRATVKGNVLVALTQGVLGGLAFWWFDIGGALLWAVLMAFLSLLPAVGAGLVWGPVAIYLLAVGRLGEGVALILYGALVIGMVDNLMRPLLVGKDTRMPDYLVLISTVGGMAIFGLNGFVIGPLIAALFIAAWQIMAIERAEDEN